MHCARCGADLLGKPKINVEGNIYCYSCSKSEVSERKTVLRETARRQYEHEKGIYDKAKGHHDARYAAWSENLRAYVDLGYLGYALAIGAAVLLYNISAEIAKGWGFIGVVIAFILWAKISSSIKQKRDGEFRAINPEPKLDMAEPKLGSVSPVNHSPHDHDGSSLATTKYREEIIRRDNLTCQVCGKKKQRKNLEVHHIIPKSKGGTDDPTNLITLCKYCHDREDWYEHVRKFPTTIKKPRPRYRRRWYRY